jgi:hypothetical protein
LDTKAERREAVEAGRGSTTPDSRSVILGWVRVNGAVEIEATGMVDFFSSDVLGMGEVGKDTMNGIDGDVALNVSGAGSMIVAQANNEMLFGEEETPNDCTVMSSDTSGKGASRPGVGKPGIGGTEVRIG